MADSRKPPALEPELHKHFRLILYNADGIVTLVPRVAYLDLLNASA